MNKEINSRVSQGVLNPEWQITRHLSELHFADVWTGSSPHIQSVDLNILPILFFHAFPKWFMLLMGLREAIARLLGLKTAHGMDVKTQLTEFTGQVGESIALFHVLDRAKSELVMGENDSHLDFRLSFIEESGGHGISITMATTVQFNNWLGRLYFIFVKPVHRIIMPIILKNMIHKIYLSNIPS